MEGRNEERLEGNGKGLGMQKIKSISCVGWRASRQLGNIAVFP